VTSHMQVEVLDGRRRQAHGLRRTAQEKCLNKFFGPRVPPCHDTQGK